MNPITPQLRTFSSIGFLLCVMIQTVPPCYATYVDCGNDDSYKQADIELNYLYRNLLKELSGEEAEKLRKAERVWMEYRDLTIDYEGDISRARKSGWWKTGAELTWQRVDNLKKILFMLSDGPDQVPDIRNFELLKKNRRPCNPEMKDDEAEMWDDVLLFKNTGQRILLFKSEVEGYNQHDGTLYPDCAGDSLLDADHVKLEWLIPDKVFVIYTSTYPSGQGLGISYYSHIYLVKGKCLFRLYYGLCGRKGKSGHYGSGGESCFKYDKEREYIVRYSRGYQYAPEEVMKNNPLAYFPELSQDMMIEKFGEECFQINGYKLKRASESAGFVKLDKRSLTVIDIARGLLMDRSVYLTDPVAPEPDPDKVREKVQELIRLNSFSGPDEMCTGKIRIR